MKQKQTPSEKDQDQVGGTWPNDTDAKLGPQPTGRTGPIDAVKRDEYDEPGENAAANEPGAPFSKSGK
ncbi:MAG: hypothetical protein V4719_02840 [Planctomycetota bacterium]